MLRMREVIIGVLLLVSILLVASTTRCPLGWPSTDGVCYRIFGLTKTWDSAQEACISIGGYLAEIPNYFVHKTIAKWLSDEYWIGLRRNGTEPFYWRSGRELSEFQIWKEDEPMNEECVALSGGDSAWKTNNCSLEKRYICMAGYVYPPLYPTPQIGCDDGELIDGRCYRLVDNKITWQTAQWECELLGSNLAEISNEIQNDKIITYFSFYTRYWIGLRLNITANQYEWRSGRVLNDSFVTWKSGNDPSSNTDNSTNCGHINGNEWVLKSCDTTYRYLCQSGFLSFPTVCDNKVVSNELDTGGICYSITDNNSATWDVANATCAANGGRLARILSGEMSDEILRIINSKGVTEGYWIGLRRDENTGQFQWTDGTNLTYNKWSDGIPMQGYGCTGVNGNSTSWLSLNCSSCYHFICETDVCNGWTVRNGTCYKKFKQSSLNWNTAVDVCEGEDGYMAEIPNIYVNNIVTDLLDGDDHCWIGLRKHKNLDYSWRIGNFSLGEAGTTTANSGGGVIGGADPNLVEKRWTFSSFGENNYCTVCMKGPLTQEAPTETCSGVSTDITIDRGYCYKIIRDIPGNLAIASLTCNNYNGVLYTFNDIRVNVRLYNRFKSSEGSFWLQDPLRYNLFQPQQGYFNLHTAIVDYSLNYAECRILTADGDTVGNTNYTNDAGSDCVDISVDGDDDCPDCDVNYICKTDYAPDEIILQNMSTYWLVSGNRNWTEAETQCVTEGGHLLEIFYEDIQNIIVSLIATEEEYLDELYWIGIGAYVSLSSQWRSGANIFYNNFSTQINTTELSCVAIDCYGSWMLSDCGEKYSFVCGKNITGFTTTTPTYSTPMNTTATNITSTEPTATPTSAIQINENRTSNCSMPDVDLKILCILLKLAIEAQNEIFFWETLLIQREEYLENLFLVLNVSTRITIKLFISRDLVLVITRIGMNVAANISIDRNNIQIYSDSFSVGTTIIILADLNQTKTSQKLLSAVITIIASNKLIGKLSIVFQIGNAAKLEHGEITCVFLTNSANEIWSSQGITTIIGMNGTVECITDHLTTFAVLFSPSKSCDRDSSGVGRQILIVSSYSLLAISLLFLLTSLVIFSMSGKRFFLADINILHFNHTISLLLAVGCFIFLIQSASKLHWLCTVVAFLLHLLWTNVFLSSLSIAMLVFYSIWIVSMKHTARKLSKYLVPIGWSLSILCALVGFAYGRLTNEYLQVDSHNESIEDDCEYSCFLSTENYLIWFFLVPIYVILLLNGSILIVCLFKIRLALKNKHKFESELTTLRRVSIGAILLIPALCLPFIVAIPLSLSQLFSESMIIVFEWAYIISNAPIGVVHFLLITCQIPEAKLPKCFHSKTSQQPTTFSMTQSNADSLVRKQHIHFNVVHPNSSNIAESSVCENNWVESRL